MAPETRVCAWLGCACNGTPRCEDAAERPQIQNGRVKSIARQTRHAKFQGRSTSRKRGKTLKKSRVPLGKKAARTTEKTACGDARAFSKNLTQKLSGTCIFGICLSNFTRKLKLNRKRNISLQLKTEFAFTCVPK